MLIQEATGFDDGVNAPRVIEIKDGHIVSDPGPMPVQGHQPATSWTARHGAVTQLAEAFEAAKSAFRALHVNILRSILTLLGIVIGVGSVITMLAIGDGAKQEVLDRISAMGSNLLTVRPGVANQRGFNNNTTLVLDDVTAIDKEIDNVVAAVPAQESNATLRFGERDTTAQIIGTSWKFPQARQWPVALGTFFGPEDEEQFEAVAVLGRTTADDLFPDEDPLGQYVLVGNQSFQVIGVMSRKGAAPNGQDQDEVVLVPYMTSQVRLSGNRYLNRATVAVADVDRIKQTTADIESLLAGRHGTVDFRIMNAGMFLEGEVASRETMTKLLGSIAAISLLVGGIGVMNIMLVSVTERTREIGIRMATGARTRNILQQFLIEALVVSSVGGLIGVIMGFTATFIVAGTTSTTVAYSVFPVVLAFGSAFATGLIFGFLPARKAAYLDPVVALQSE